VLWLLPPTRPVVPSSSALPFFLTPNGRRVVATPGLSKIVAIAFQKPANLLQIPGVCCETHKFVENSLAKNAGALDSDEPLPPEI
jgi:hypothetical protein